MKGKKQQQELSESAEDAFMAELERREAEINRFAKVVEKDQLPEQEVVIQETRVSKKDAVAAELKKCEKQLANGDSLKEQLLNMKIALLILARECDDNHDIWARIASLDDLIKRARTQKQPVKAQEPELEDMPIDEYEDEFGEERAAFGEELGEEELEEDEDLAEKLAGLQVASRVNAAQVSSRMKRLGLQDGVYDFGTRDEAFPQIGVQLAAKTNKAADSLGARLEDLAQQKKKAKVEAFKTKAAAGELEAPQKEQKRESKKKEPKTLEPKYFEAHASKLPRRKADDGQQRPASKALQKNQPAMKQAKKKIAKLTYAKKFNMMEHKKRAYIRQREPRMENYIGETMLKYQDKK